MENKITTISLIKSFYLANEFLKHESTKRKIDNRLQRNNRFP